MAVGLRIEASLQTAGLGVVAVDFTGTIAPVEARELLHLSGIDHLVLGAVLVAGQLVQSRHESLVLLRQRVTAIEHLERAPRSIAVDDFPDAALPEIAIGIGLAVLAVVSVE